VKELLPFSLTLPPPNLHRQPRSIHSPVRQQPYHAVHADRTAGDYYDSSGDTMKEVEGADSRPGRKIITYYDEKCKIITFIQDYLYIIVP
jgi:hypothetical protein